MTNEEAIRIIKIVLAVAEDFEITVQGEEFTEEKCKKAVEIVTKALEQQPTTGEWISIDATHSKCEICEAIFEITSPNAEVNFCPNCGVKMEVNADDE